MSTFFTVEVVFDNGGVWSKPYSYNSKKEYKGDVVVPTRKYVSIGRVFRCTPVSEPNPAWKYVLGNLGIIE